MRTLRDGQRLTAFQAGALALAIIVVGGYLALWKDIPFTRPYEIHAVFKNAPPIQKDMDVRIAGVSVGKIAAVETVDGQTPGTKVTLKLNDEALPIHSDAELKLRPRILLEGNLFVDLEPGTPAAGKLSDGDTIPASRTSAPVQFDQVQGVFQSDTRGDLQKLLAGLGDALDGEPLPGEDDDQDPSTAGETAGESLNDSLAHAAGSLRGGAITSEALLGTRLHDLSKLVSGTQRISGALSSREDQLEELLTNLDTTLGALAAEQASLRQTVRQLPRVLDAANPALDSLDRAFPPARAFALEMVPGLREMPGTIDAAFPWVEQTRALVSPVELQGLVEDLRPAVDDLARFAEGQLGLLPQLDLFARCQSEVVLPTAEQRIDDGVLTTGLKSYEELWQALVGLNGAAQNFDGNGYYGRAQLGGGYGAQTTSVGKIYRSLQGSASAPPLGTRPATTPKPPFETGVPCHRNSPPDLNSAKIGVGP